MIKDQLVARLSENVWVNARVLPFESGESFIIIEAICRIRCGVNPATLTSICSEPFRMIPFRSCITDPQLQEFCAVEFLYHKLGRKQILTGAEARKAIHELEDNVKAAALEQGKQMMKDLADELFKNI